MGTELATQTAGTALIPKAKAEAIDNLEMIVSMSRNEIKTAKPMRKAFAVAAAMKAIEDAITEPMMADIMNLMDSPLGFKTDRKPGATKKNKKTNEWEDVKPYHPKTIKRCIIVGLLAGAQLAGNELNIIAAQCYFTKEFMLSVVMNFPGLNDFRMAIGAAGKHGENTAIMTGRASWLVNGEEFSVECQRTDDFDERIVVNAYGTSGPDQIRGLGESKLLRRVVAVLTGLNLDTRPSDVGTPGTVEGLTESAVHLEHENEDATIDDGGDQGDSKDGEVSKEARDAANNYLLSSETEIYNQTTASKTLKMANDCTKGVDNVDWPLCLKEHVIDEISTAKDVQLARLRDAAKK